jgi:hypothetical protein
VPYLGHAVQPPGNWARDFHVTPEDNYGSLAAYYDLAWLSWRTAFWRLGRLGREGYGPRDFMGNGGGGGVEWAGR